MAIYIAFSSQEYGINASGNNLLFEVNSEEIYITGINSKLITNDTTLSSDGKIRVNNINGKFLVVGPNSSMKTENIYIEGENIDGVFSRSNDTSEIDVLNVFDNKTAYIKDNQTEMYANNVKYNKETSLIELENNVKIIRNGEIITGDYGTLDTATNSYKVKSKNSKKVKVTIIDNDE